MKTTFRTQLAVITTALAIFTLLSIQQSYASTNSAQAVGQTQTSSSETEAGMGTVITEINTTIESFAIIEDHAMLTINRKAFQPRLTATYSRPNFTRPIRRAPIKRKRQTQH